MVVLIFLIVFSLSYGHSLTTAVEYSEAVVVKINYSDGTPFSYEKYEIYSPEDEVIPYQVGRTDREGRIIFIPDTQGKWKIKAFSEDGHGIVKEINIEKVKKEGMGEEKTGFLIKVLSGIILIFLIYSVFYLTVRRRKVGKED